MRLTMLNLLIIRKLPKNTITFMRSLIMNLMKNKINYCIAVLVILFGASYLALEHIGAYGLSNFAWLVILLPLFSRSLSSLFLKNKTNIADRVVISAGLLVTALLILGLTLNTIGLAIHRPTLLPKYIVPSFDLMFFVVFIWSLLKKPELVLLNLGIKNRLRRLLPIAFPIILPLISLLGVVQ